MMSGWGLGWLGMGFWMLVPLLLLGLVIYLAVRAALPDRAKVLTQGDAPSSGGNRALAILEERFARGEMDAEQFRSMRQELSSSPGSKSDLKR